MVKRRRTKGQTMICKNHTENQRSSNMNPTKNRRWFQYNQFLLH